MKRRDIRGQRVHVAPPAAVQGPVTPDPAVQLARLAAARPEAVQVEGIAGGRRELEARRLELEQALQPEVDRQADVLARQSRALADALGFEARARAAGQLGGVLEADHIRRARATERGYRYAPPPGLG